MNKVAETKTPSAAADKIAHTTKNSGSLLAQRDSVESNHAKPGHTPAPWEIRIGTSKDGIYAKGFCIALVNEGQHRPANATLIAAAPELLEACKLAYQFLDSLPHGWLAKTSGDVGALNDFYCSAGCRFVQAEIKSAEAK